MTECYAEFIDGSYSYDDCGCPDCTEALHDEVEYQVESGDLTDAQGQAAHARPDARGYY